MQEIGTSFVDFIKKRTASTIFASYIFFWATLHWQGIYVALFIDEDKILSKYGLLKNEYINQYFFGRHGDFDPMFYLGIFWPLFLTLLFIWPIPQYVLIHIYDIEQKHKTEKIRIKLAEEKARTAFVTQKVTQESKAVKAKTILSRAKQSAKQVDPSILWDEEYELFKADPAFLSFANVLESIYEHNGQKSDYDNYNGERFTLPGGSLKIADTLGLIRFELDKTISLTDKGKYFAKLYPHYASR